MSTKEDSVGFQPVVENSVPFQLPAEKGCVDVDVEANRVVVVISGIFVGEMTNAINVLGEFFAGRDVTVHCNASKGRVDVNWNDSVLVIDILEVL